MKTWTPVCALLLITATWGGASMGQQAEITSSHSACFEGMELISLMGSAVQQTEAPELLWLTDGYVSTFVELRLRKHGLPITAKRLSNEEFLRRNAAILDADVFVTGIPGTQGFEIKIQLRMNQLVVFPKTRKSDLATTWERFHGSATGDAAAVKDAVDSLLDGLVNQLINEYLAANPRTAKIP